MDGYIQSSVKRRIADKQKTSPKDVCLPTNIEYAKEMIQEDLETVETYKASKKAKTTPRRHKDGIKNIPQWKAEAAKRILKIILLRTRLHTT